MIVPDELLGWRPQVRKMSVAALAALALEENEAILQGWRKESAIRRRMALNELVRRGAISGYKLVPIEEGDRR